MKWDTVAIVGVGLIGASIGMAVKARGLARRVIGVGRRRARLQIALDGGAIDQAETDLAAGVREAELVLVCTPVERIPEFIRQAAQHVPPGAILSDAGSVKGKICEELADESLAPAVFIGGHPMAGKAKSGAEYGDADLFKGRPVVLTPWEEAPAETVQRLQTFWESLGSRVMVLSPQEHDRAVASISHLPHLAAAALAAVTPAEHLPLASSGWSGATRIAGGDVEMWRQILLANPENVLEALGRLSSLLGRWRLALEQEDSEAIASLLREGKELRDRLADEPGDA